MHLVDRIVTSKVSSEFLSRCSVCHRPTTASDIVILGKDEEVRPQVWTVRYDCPICRKIWQRNLVITIRYVTEDPIENDSTL